MTVEILSYGMPRAAHKRGAVSHMLSLRDIVGSSRQGATTHERPE